MTIGPSGGFGGSVQLVVLGIDLSGPLAGAVLMPVSAVPYPAAANPPASLLTLIAEVIQRPTDLALGDRELIRALGSVVAALAAGPIAAPDTAGSPDDTTSPTHRLTVLLRWLLDGLMNSSGARRLSPRDLRAVALAVPTWLPASGRQAVSRAAQSAGFGQAEVVDAPVALLVAQNAGDSRPALVIDLGPVDTTLALIEPVPDDPLPYRVKDFVRIDSPLIPPPPLAAPSALSSLPDTPVAPSALVLLQTALVDLGVAEGTLPLWITGAQGRSLVSALSGSWHVPIRVVPNHNRAVAIGAAWLASTRPPAQAPSPVHRGLGIDLSTGTPRLATLIEAAPPPLLTQPGLVAPDNDLNSAPIVDQLVDRVCLAALDTAAPGARTVVSGSSVDEVASVSRNRAWVVHHPAAYLGLDHIPVGDGTPVRLDGALGPVLPTAVAAGFFRSLLGEARREVPEPGGTPVWVRPLLV